MENINIRFNASANFGQVSQQITALNNQLAAMQAGLAANAGAVASSATGFRNNVRNLGNMSVETMRVTSAAENYTKALQKQDITLRQAIKNRQTFNQVLREQYALSRASAMQWTQGNRGRSTLDLIVPTDAPARLGNFRNTLSQVRAGTISTSVAMGEMAIKMGLVSQVAASGAANMIKWGKNTQWAGRQLMVGFTMPVIAAGAAMGVLAYKVESELTRINKVYDFSVSKDQDAAKFAQESATLRVNSLNAARVAAQQYGAAIQDTLKVEANLAATGEKGSELIGKTTEVMRLATLGEMDYQQALETTITLQTVYKQNTEELAKSFNYMNAVENATSLSIEDFSKAIPKVAGPLATLGEGLQTAGTLLAAMKSRGIQATEGANAIKASFNRVLNPTRAAKKMFEELTNQSLTDLVDKTQGKVLPTFEELEKATKNLSGLQKQQLFGKLFGTQQTTRLQAIVEEMANLRDETTQVGKAFQIAQQDSGDWAKSADREMKALQESASGRFKIVLESLKVQLAEAGEPFLRAGAMIIGVVGSIVKAFNELPQGVKTLLSVGVIGAAIAGPIVMLVGLFANLMGQALKLGSSLLGLVFRFRALLPEQVASRLAAMQNAQAMTTEAVAAEALTNTLTHLTAALVRATGAQATFVQTSQGLRLAPPMPTNAPITGPLTPTFSGYRDATGRTITRQEGMQWQRAQQAAASINQNSASTRRNFQMMGGSFQTIALTGGIMGSMATDSGTVANNIANAAVAAGLIATVLAGPLTKFFTSVGTLIAPAFAAMGRAGTAMFGRIGAAGTAAFSRIGGAISGATAMLGGMGAVAGTLLAVAIAIGAAWYIINKNIEASRKEQEEVANSAKDWAETLGFAYQETQAIATENGKNVDSITDKMNKFRSNNEDAVKDMQRFYDASEAEKWGRAIEEGVKVRLRGGTAEAAKEATRIALRIMGEEFDDKKFQVMIDAKMNFTSFDSVLEQRLKAVSSDMSEAVNKQFDQSGSESFARFFAGEKTIQQKAGAQIQQNARDLWDIYDNTQAAEKDRVFNKIATSVNEENARIFKMYSEKYKSQFEKMGIETFSDWTKYLQANTGQGDEGFTLGAQLGLTDAEIEMVMRATDATKGFNKEFGHMQGIPDDKVRNLVDTQSLKEFIPELGRVKSGIDVVKDAQRQWSEALEQRSMKDKNFTEVEQLALLNLYRRKAGLADATVAEQGFGDAIEDTTRAVSDYSDELEMNADNVQDFINAQKQVMSGTMDDVFSRAEEIMNEKQQREIDAINARSDARSKAIDQAQERADKRFDERQDKTEKRFEDKQDALDKKFEGKQRAFDTRWDGLMESHEKKWELRIDKETAGYDNRIKKIQDAIKAEQDAEQKRQEIFEREKTRIQRAAQLANQNIDFQMAINSGNLEEAAKIGNDLQSQIGQWNTEDTAAASQTDSEKKIAGLEKQITTVEAERDRRLKILNQLEEAEKKQLANRRQREQDALKAQREAAEKSLALAREKALKQIQIERESYNKGVQAQREALQKETQDKVNATQRKFAAAKRALDQELAALRAFVPKNKAELDAHVKKVEEAYAKHGVNLKARGNEWGKYVGNALSANVKAAAEGLKSQIQWEAIGKKITDSMVNGAFSMSTAEFMKWVTTGQLPKNYAGPGSTRSPSNSQEWGGVPYAPGQGPNGFVTRHAGGPVGGAMKYNNRGGRPANSALRSDETWGLLKKNEYVINGDTHKNMGTDFFDNVNRNKGFGTGGPGLGMVGMFGAALAGAYSQMVSNAINSAGQSAMSMGTDLMGIPGEAGAYGNVKLGADQLANAATIIGVGKSMGATTTDLIVSIMTAMQESTLKNLNYGDRDSVGLFQQRPSQGWGTVEQIMNPSYAARKFFDGLLAMKNRAKLPLWEQAQRVQRSAFPMAYAKWEQMARAVVSGTGISSGTGNQRGWRKPVNGFVTQNWSNRHGGMDFGVPEGTPVQAANAGTVVASEDLRGNQNGGYRSYGRYVVLDHGGVSTLYAHLSSRGARVGQRVGSGSVIGLSGNTGNSTGPHLHFETRGAAGFPGFDPRSLIPGLKVGGKIRYDNTIANLHKNETVLTAPLSAKLERGIDRIDSGGPSTYNFNINAESINTEIDFERVIEKALDRMESKKGRSRYVK
jgi:TP901 family phage tail tape measure protein